MVRRHSNDDVQIIVKVSIDVVCMFIFIAVCHANKSIVKLLQRPSQEALVPLLQSPVKIKERHGYRPEEISCSMWQLELGQCHREGFRQDDNSHHKPGI